MEYTNIKIYNVIINIAAKCKLNFDYFFRIQDSIKMIFDQILVYFMTNIPNMFPNSITRPVNL